MKRKTRKFLSCMAAVVLSFSMLMPTQIQAQTPDEMKLTILGTSDMHGNLTSWSYEANKDYENSGFARTATLVNEVRKENPNTLVIDNGDTIQGTILTDELYNKDLSKPNPVIAMMNYIGYDSMTLGNHEFNFGTGLIRKLEKEATFPLLAANIYKAGTDESFVKPYVVKEVGDVKVGIVGFTVPSVPRWDANKQGIKELSFEHMANEAEKYVKILKEEEKVDVIVATAHAGLESRHEADGSDAAQLIAEKCPDIDVLLLGHDHSTVNQTINGVLVAAPYKDREVVQFDLSLTKKDGTWDVVEKTTTLQSLKNYASDPAAEAVGKEADTATRKFLEKKIGVASDDFHPASEVEGIPEAQIRDTAVIDLINQVQLEATGADVAAAALFKPSANLPKGDLSYVNVFDIYQYANTLVGVEVTGKELKAYMEWSAAYYNTYKPGDLTISFNQNIRGYAYDMFQGVDYTIDVSQPAGSRIKDVMYKGQPLADDAVLKLAINDYRYSGIGPSGDKILNGTPYFESDKALRNYIREYIEEQGTIIPTTDNNWKIVGADWNPELRALAVDAVNAGTIEIPKSADGRTNNIRAVTEADLIVKGLHPAYTDYMAILHTNDSHTKLEESKNDGMGFAKVANYVKDMRKSYGKDKVLLLDAGDTLHGIPLVTTTRGEAMTKVMNLIGYDAMAAGNHDFNYGYKRLLELKEMLNFEVLGANVVDNTGESILTPYIIKEVAGKKVAIFGLSTPDTTTKTHPKNVEGLTFKDPIVVAQTMVKELEGKADIIIALAHLGFEDDSSVSSQEVAEAVKGIDLIVDGHSHTSLPQGKVVNDTLIVQSGDYTKNIGQVNIYFKADGTFEFVAEHVTKADGASLVADKEVVDLIKVLKEEFEVIAGEVVGTTPVLLEGTREVVRAGESNLGNLITNALLYATGADVALTNGGGIRASIDVGDITKKEVITVLPFGNTGTMIEVTGQEIKEALEVGVAKYPVANGAFSHVAGMTYSFDPAQPEGSKIVEILINGKPIDMAKTYKLATNDFIAAGGDGYAMFKGNKVIGEYSALDELVIQYLEDKGVEGIEVSGRITPIEAEVALVPAA
ncbi:MAG: 5'-nucleotidase C-terminal domain-containing protein [Cellulosilyticaceae bacterium]